MQSLTVSACVAGSVIVQATGEPFASVHTPLLAVTAVPLMVVASVHSDHSYCAGVPDMPTVPPPPAPTATHAAPLYLQVTLSVPTVEQSFAAVVPFVISYKLTPLEFGLAGNCAIVPDGISNCAEELPGVSFPYCSAFAVAQIRIANNTKSIFFTKSPQSKFQLMFQIRLGLYPPDQPLQRHQHRQVLFLHRYYCKQLH